jgi:hypothetical protein
MRATLIMALAVLLYIVHRWATNQSAVTLPIVLSGLFVIFVIGVLDSFSKTQEIARGFAWLFFIVAAYNAIPAFTGAIKSAQSGASKGAQQEGFNLPGGG